MTQHLGRIYRELAAGRLSQQAALEQIKALKQGRSAVEDTLLATASWDSAPALSAIAPADYESHHVLLVGVQGIDLSELQSSLPGSRCSVVPVQLEDAPRAYSDTAFACFKTVRAILERKPQRPVLVQLVIGDHPHASLYTGLSGLFATAALENPLVDGRIILTSRDASSADLACQLQQRGDVVERVISYREHRPGTERLRRSWRFLERQAAPTSGNLFKENGVYLISGGLGGLGLLFAREIQKQTSGATLILAGRSALTDTKHASLASLQRTGRVEYRVLDVTDADRVRRLIEAIVAEYGQLNGVIHGAGTVLDDFILKKPDANFRSVLAPKVSGTQNLDTATASTDLDFLWLFSSIAAWAGNVGQADYAAANGFLEQFADHRNRLVAAGERRGHTLAVAWPHWLDGGMNIDAASMTALQQRTGLRSLQTAAGMQALYNAVASSLGHVMVMAGDVVQMRRALLAEPAAKPETPMIQVAPAAGDLREKTREFLRREFSVVLKIPAQRIDARAPLENYGIDSILAMNLTNQLEATFGTLAKTLFFEYLTLDELAGYFFQAHSDKLAKLFAAPAAVAPIAQTAVATPAISRVGRRARQRYLAAAAPTPAAVANEPIAIIGLSGRYPEAPDLQQFWINLRDGKDCIVEIPPERWDWRRYYSEDRTEPGRHHSKWGGFIAGVDEFDPRFFNIAPREAPGIDPQERLFLQHAWLAIEDAGLTRASLQVPNEAGLPGQVGVYAGVMYGEYNVSGSLASIANRVSYFLNLHGPSLTLDTMCSSSLTAIHLACQDLRLGRTRLAIAGGVNVSIHPNKYRMLSGGQFISSDGHCQSFGEGGDGYIPGEGVGVAILKRLSDAERDGNPIYGVIRGSALNHGGKTNGYTVPNPQAQADVICQALAEANVDPRQVTYIEAHGTGTKLGDPIEIAALTKAFHERSDGGAKPVGFCRIGSAKSNIGHCESAAGIAGITKVLLQLQHQVIVPSLHSRKLNPHIDFQATPFVVNQTLTAWEQPLIEGRGAPRIAGISSFGAGGSNAHVIIEEYQSPVRSAASSSQALVPLSARTADQLQQRACDLAAFIERHGGKVDLTALAYTLQVGREAMDERVAFVVGSVDELLANLGAFIAGGADEVQRGQVKQHRDLLAAWIDDARFQADVEQWIADRRLTQLAGVWVKGWELDWRRLVDDVPRSMSLPGYPFAKERYWIDPVPAAEPVSAALLHPLLHANTSNLLQQSYTSKFSGNESFVSVDASGAKVVPPSVALEMIRAAVELAAPKAGTGTWQIQEIAWDKPIVICGERPICTALFARDNDEIDVEIYSGGTDEDADESVHCQSRVVFNREPATKPLAAEQALLPVDAQPINTNAQTRIVSSPREIPLVLGARASSGSQPAVVESAAALQKPTRIALLASSEVISFQSTAKGLVKLSDHVGQADVVQPGSHDASVRLFDLGEGVFSIEVASTFGTSIDSLMFALRRCSQETTAKVVVLKGTVDFWQRETASLGEAVAAGLFNAIASFPAPVVAVTPDGGSGAAFLLATVCDFIVCSDTGCYGCSEVAQTPALHRLFQERLGPAVASQVSRGQQDGLTLRSAGWACRVVPRDEVEANAAGLASDLAQKPALALQLLKEHLNRYLVPLIQKLAGDDRSDDGAVASSREASFDAWHERLREIDLASALPTAGNIVPLRSAVVNVTAHPEGVVVVTLQDRDARNMFSPALVSGLKEAFGHIERTPDFKVVVLTGYDSFFATGGTRETLMAIQQGEAQFTDEKVFQLPMDCSLPVIAAMQGHAIGGGWSFGMFADVVVLSEESRYLSPYMSYGFTPGAGSTLVFPKKIGYDLAKETLLTAREMSGRDLSKRGLHLPVLPRKHVLPAAVRLAGLMAAERSRAELQEQKHRATRSLRELREETYRRELAMHEKTFVRQAATLRNIESKFSAPPSQQPVPAATAVVPTVTALSSKLREMLAQELHLGAEEIDEHAQFIDLGLDSITGVTWIGKINAHYGTSIEATKVYNHPTLADFSRYVAGEAKTQNASSPAMAQTAPVVATSSVVDALRHMLAKELHLRPEEIDETAQFIDLGLDSITGVTWVRKINEQYGVSIEATKVYSHPTLREISRYVQQEAEQAGTLSKAREPAVPAIEPSPVANAVAARGNLISWRRSRSSARFASLAPPSAPVADKSLQPIAVIGMAGQFPKARDLDQFWRNLAEGRNCIEEIGRDRWSLAAHFQPGAPTPGKTNSKWLGALEDFDRFDPLFFNISPTEAECMDPQQRLFLQSCWHSIENAGYNPQSLSGSQCGVFVGCGASDYHQLSREQQLSAQGFTGAATSILAARISYFLNLRGPCVSIDTACSSSLVAIANACDSLNAGNSDVALAGGVYVMGGPAMHIMTAQAGMLSTDGRCYTFDQRANGFVPGEGVGVVMLKRLADAERDGDRILAVVQGWGVNQDGRTNGITAPNEDSQTRLLQSVYRKFAIDPSGIQLIEAHGTGTKLGDPIEVAGLKAAFKAFTAKERFCALGSVKSNIGHCLTAAGAAGFIKLLLALKHRQLPPTINFERHNEHIQLAGSPFFINDSQRDWNVGEREQRRAAISSFGFSGTNAHIVVGEYLPVLRNAAQASAITQDGKVIVCLSARTEAQLKQKAQDLLTYLRREPGVRLLDVAYTSQVGRESMGERLALLADSITTLVSKLAAFVAGDQDVHDVFQGQVKRHKEGLKLVSEDDDVRRAIVDKWLERRQLGKLADWWVKGLELDWTAMYGSARPNRIELPNYPFARERYWLTAAADSANVSVDMEVARSVRDHDRISYVHRWEEEASVVQVLPASHKKALIVCTDSSFGFETTIRDFHEHHGNGQVLLVRIGDETRQLSAGEWLCGVRDEQGFDRCLERAGDIDALYFLATTEQSPATLTGDPLLANQERNEIQLLRLVKSLKRHARADGHIDTYLVTVDNHPLDGRGNHCWGAGAAGLGYSLAQGNHQFRVRNLDLSSDDLRDAKRRASVMTAVTRELHSDRGEVFKLHAGHRYRRTFLPLQWDQAASSVLKQNGVYIIVGGAGIVGQILTRNLIRKYRAHVYWFGRSEPGSTRIGSALRLFEDAGDKVRYLQADVLDADSLRRAVESVKQQHARIHGAIFSGMVFGIENSIDQTTEVDFRAILEVKTRGTRMFFNALRYEPLDFMCYFSSGQAYSFSGAAKLSAYATGITFADSFVRSIQGTSAFPVGSINWGFWKSAVEERIAKLDGVSTRSLDALEDAEGFERFERFVAELHHGRLSQVLCMRASREVEALMNCKPGEFVALAGSTSTPAAFPMQLIDIPLDRIVSLQQAHASSRLEEWFARLLFAQINQLMHATGPALPQTEAELRRRCKILDKYAPWLHESLGMLAEAGLLELHGDSIQRWQTQDSAATWAQWRAHKAQYIDDSNTRALAALTDECLEQLPGILQGKVLATDVIFPNASMDKVAGLYRHNAVADTFNEIVASAVLAYLRQRIEINPQTRLRILEVGAGTGGTSAAVFARLSPFKASIEKYCYTDVSKAFFFHAERNYLPEHPYIVCQRLDIEQPVEAQGIELGTYDLVIATNVLHATQNIRKTLRNAKAALRQDGFIILNEMSDKSLSTHLTFGLLDGWWLFQDAELRIPGCPGLYPATWQRVLEGEGFKSVLLPASAGRSLGNQVIVARSDGVIRLQTAVVASRPQPKAASKRARPLQLAKTAPTDLAAFVRNGILDALSVTLKIPVDSIEPESAFSDYGIDSILGVSFIDRINARFALALNTAIIFEYSSVERLSRHVLNAHGKHINAQESTPADMTPEPDEPVVEPERQETTATPRSADGDGAEIAIVGMSGQFPKAANARDFWDNLMRGVDGVEELPARYLNQATHFSTVKQRGKTRCKWGGILADRDCFDPLFFSISPKEAESMNPHQRLVMQESWNALEDAGYNPKQLSGTPTGIFIGAEPAGYIGATFTGLSDAIIASRLSYALNFTGPAFVVNTGCSSSAVAIHLACESLRNGESRLVLAGGVNACMHQNIQVRLDEIEMLSPSGRCYTFDKAGDGTIISEGIGMLVLKRLDDAIADGDHIYATLCASGMNQDGASNGITAPNGAAQEQLITNVYDRFGIDAEAISYVEAHGTGTRLGDPVETNALVRAFRKYSSKVGWCAVGSAKSHIGHAAAAAGVIGIIKVLLSMQHRRLPKLLNFKELNPLIDFDGSPFFINTEASEWLTPAGVPRMAAINSFGHSGTNVHLVLKEYLPAQPGLLDTVNEAIVPLSAKTSEQLRQKCDELLRFIERSPAGIDIASLAYTLQVGREAMDERLGFVVDSVPALRAQLQGYLAGNGHGVIRGQAKRSSEPPLGGGESPSSLLTQWVKGRAVDWSTLWGGACPRRMSLPGYPFAKERYWIDTAFEAQPPAVSLPATLPAMDGGSLEDIIDKIDDDSLATHEAVQLLRKIV